MEQVTYKSSFTGEEVKEGEGKGMGADVRNCKVDSIRV